MQMKELVKERSAWLGCAMIWIVLYHARIDTALKIYNFVASIGYGGVDICIFASGIGCYYSLSRSEDICAFLKRRFVRLAPTYWCFLTFWIIYKVCFSEISARGAFCNFLGLEYITNKGEAFNWYITAILLLYLIAPYLKQMVERLTDKKSLLMVLGSIIISMAFWESKTYIIIFTRIPLFILGMIFARKCQNGDCLSKKAIRIIWGIAVGGIVLLKLCFDFCSEQLWTHGLYWYPFILITPGICIFISMCLAWIKKYKHLRWIKKALEFIGQYSFEIYLVHIPLFEYVHKMIEERGVIQHRNLILFGTIVFTVIGCVLLRAIVNGVCRIYKQETGR